MNDKSPVLADEICKLSGITERKNPGNTVFSKGELRRIFVQLNILTSGSPLAGYSNETLLQELASRNYFKDN